MWNSTKITRKLSVRYPIIQAGMAGGTTTPELVAAVSNAGGLGTLGAGYMSAAQLQSAIHDIKVRTTNPFGVNLFVPEIPNVSDDEVEEANVLLRPYREKLHLEDPELPKPSAHIYEEQLKVLLEEKVPVCSFTFGVPSTEVIQQLQEENMVVIGTATTVKEAMINEEQGVDMVVMQGSEAGGHRSTFSESFSQGMVGTMALIPQTVDHVQIPVIAAGGIMDGRGVLAAQALGAQAVQMGTAFVTALESGAKAQHIDAILNSTEDQTTITSVFSGKPARGIQNAFIQEMTPYEHQLPGYPTLNTLTKQIRKEAAQQNRPEWMHLWSGQAPRLSTRQSAEGIMKEIIAYIEEKDSH